MKVGTSSLLMLMFLAAPLSHGDKVADLTAKAQTGDVAAQVELGGLFAKGEGVAKDEKEAAKWFKLAAGQGNPEAQLFMGSAYLRGRVFRRDGGEAAKWYLLAAEQGNPVAQCQIGRMHMTGAGVPKDDVQACMWANLASAQGDLAAKNLLVILTRRMTPAQIQQAQELTRLHGETHKPELPVAEPPPALEPIKPEDLEPGAD